MRVTTRPSSEIAGSCPKLRGEPRFLYDLAMSEGVTIDLAALRKLIVENAGPGKKWTRRALSLAATNGRNPDLVRDIFRVDKRKPTIEAASGLCAALGVNVAEVTRVTVTPANDNSAWLRVVGSVRAGTWREQPEWPEEEHYEVEVGPNDEEGERFGLIVEGQSMNKTLPSGIALDCINLIGSGLTAEDGDYVIVERKKADLYERTVKRLSRQSDGSWALIAESTQPEFKDPIPIGRPEPGMFGDDETRVVAIVDKAHVLLPRTRRRAVGE